MSEKEVISKSCCCRNDDQRRKTLGDFAFSEQKNNKVLFLLWYWGLHQRTVLNENYVYQFGWWARDKSLAELLKFRSPCVRSYLNQNIVRLGGINFFSLSFWTKGQRTRFELEETVACYSSKSYEENNSHDKKFEKEFLDEIITIIFNKDQMLT